eukprot:CAMPEP_0174725554 /NCGR_PEP_ID=MMETSP1094-20130205/45895_1 /TAXON_ID=156173 /ORGANISM="Chrysochromulina brevifilum, Strain UTEX LB 985" /LENGTH=139 /DNA_ID=CAMNT_0015926981 /DNA_START=54 /DNA_END=470 /DNA_ORIENTATION=+
MRCVMLMVQVLQVLETVLKHGALLTFAAHHQRLSRRSAGALAFVAVPGPGPSSQWVHRGQSTPPSLTSLQHPPIPSSETPSPVHNVATKHAETTRQPWISHPPQYPDATQNLALKGHSPNASSEVAGDPAAAPAATHPT